MRQYHKQLYELKHSQNFIKSQLLSQSLVNMMHVNNQDLIIEIGPGKGSLTKALLPICDRLIGVELDSELNTRLNREFVSFNNVSFVNEDIIDYKFPVSMDYKVVGNIPFAITSDLIRKLLESENPPLMTYIIVQKEAAQRLATREYENFFALQYKPWFESKILKNISRNEFFPIPSVDSTLLEIVRLESPMLPIEDREEYTKFVSFCFLNWKITVKSVLKKFFTLKQLGIMSREYKINFELKPSQITFDQWLTLFELYKQFVSKEKKEKLGNLNKF